MSTATPLSALAMVRPSSRRMNAPLQPHLTPSSGAPKDDSAKATPAARTSSNARRAARWWTLFRTESASNDVARVVWADFGRTLTAAVLDPGDPSVPLNTCYAVRCQDPTDALALAAILNSALAAAWLAAIAEPARGGYRRYLGWTLSLLPLPRHWERARATLVPLATRARDGAPVSDAELLDAVIRAYELRRGAVGALLDWSIR